MNNAPVEPQLQQEPEEIATTSKAQDPPAIITPEVSDVSLVTLKEGHVVSHSRHGGAGGGGGGSPSGSEEDDISFEEDVNVSEKGDVT